MHAKDIDQKPIYIFGPNGQGGISQLIQYQVKILNKHNWAVHFIQTNNNSLWIKKIIVFILACGKLVFTVPKFSICHIHSSSHRSFLRKAFLVFLASFKGNKIVFHIHSGSFWEFYKSSSQILKCFIHFTLRRSDVLIGLSSGLSSPLKKHFKYKKFIEIPNCVPIPSQKCSLTEPVVLFLGRLSKEKGVYDLLNAFKLVLEKIPNAQLILAGSISDTSLIHLIEKLKISDSVLLTGWANDKQKTHYFLRSSVFVLPSFSEGMPLSLLEAMSYGLPCIVSSVGGIKDIIQNDVNGLLISPGDFHALSMNLILLLTNSSMRSRLGENARNYIKANHTLEIFFKKLYEIYSLLNPHLKNEKFHEN